MKINRGRRTTLGWLGMLAFVSTAKAQIIPVEIAALSDIASQGWYKAFEFHGRPALAVWTAILQPNGLAVGSGFLLAYVLECTHAGCRLSLPNAGILLSCPCHGSLFEIENGARLAGPARDPLPKIKLELRGTRVWAVEFVD